MKTLVDQAPFPAKQDFSPISLQLSSLFTRITPAGSVAGFQINRADDHCLTPCRNPQAEEAIELANNLVDWCENVVQFLNQYCFSAQAYSSTKSDVSSVFKHDTVTLACLPLLQDDKNRPTLADDANKLLDASFKSVDAKIETLHLAFPKDSSLLSQKEAELGFLVTFLSLVSFNLKDSLSYLERLIEVQIREALGRHIDPTDFDGTSFTYVSPRSSLTHTLYFRLYAISESNLFQPSLYAKAILLSSQKTRPCTRGHFEFGAKGQAYSNHCVYCYGFYSTHVFHS